MTRDEAQELLNIIYMPDSPQDEKRLAYERLSELFLLLLPEDK